MLAAADIVRLALDRAKGQGAYAQQLRDIDDLYYGEFDIGEPELDNRQKRAEVANLAMQGIDQHGMRIASVVPDQVWEPLKSGVQVSERKAQRRRQAMFGLWEENAVGLLLHYRARHMIAYARSPIQLRPRRLRRGDPRWGENNGWTVEWVLRTPHETFPSPSINPAAVAPTDCLFRYSRPLRWLETNYPDKAGAVAAMVGDRPIRRRDVTVELVEYVDSEETVLVATGIGEPSDKMAREASYGLATIVELDSPGSTRGGEQWTVELDRYPNRAGDVGCPVVVPRRVALGKEAGQFDQMKGLYIAAAKLMALEMAAVTKSVFPSTYVEDADPNQPATIQAANPMTGKIGRVHGGKIVQLQLSPGFQTYPTIDRLTEAQRQTGLIPSDFSGYSATNIRTGKRGADVLSNTVDFSIQEAQLVFQASLKREDEVAAAIAKAYFRGSSKSFAVSWPGARGKIDYKPEDIFEPGATHSIEYPAIGTDAARLGVELAQAQGTGAMSMDTYRRKHPLIDDHEFEANQVTVEQLRTALLEGAKQQAMSGELPVADLGRVIELVVAGDPVEVAVRKAHEEAQQRQASSGPPGTPEGAVPPGSPEAQPGLSLPGMGAEAGTGAPAEPVPLGPAAALLSRLRSTSNPVKVGAA